MPFLRNILQEKWFFSVALHRQERAQVLMNVQKVGDSGANILGQVATLALKSLTFNSPALQPALFFSKQQQQCWNLQNLQDLRARCGECGAAAASADVCWQQSRQVCRAERAAEQRSGEPAAPCAAAAPLCLFASPIHLLLLLLLLHLLLLLLLLLVAAVRWRYTLQASAPASTFCTCGNRHLYF